ncbi:MAG: zinc ABC transporter substrate-binding protein [Clostridia bacterium]|nr:zinc ABC transporter substrate-binding protein [Clostridia bacterium]NCC75603.1 zinc ABC transporter substrate-binding protein [Clostridia bacterium]
MISHHKPHRLRFFIFLILTALLLASLAACQAAPATSTPAATTAPATDAATAAASEPATPSTAASQETLTYVTSLYPIYVTALNLTSGIAGVEVVNMTGTITGCLHDYQLSPGDLTTIETADVFIYNGADLESYLDQVTDNYPDLPLLDASAGIELLDENPHVWVSVSLMMRQVEAIAQGMAQQDPANRAAYLANAETYMEKLSALRDDLHAAIDPLPNRDIVTFHEAFPYFAQEFTLNIAAVVEREPDSQPSAAELAQTIDLIRDLEIQAIFVEPQYVADTADTIARETGVPVFTLDPASSGPLEDPDAYLKIMRQNGTVLTQALR